MKIISGLIKAVTAGWKHYKNLKAIEPVCMDIQGEKAKWMLYVAEHSPLTVEDIITCCLYEFAEIYGLSREEVTEEIIDIAGRGWSSENVIEILKIKWGNMAHCKRPIYTSL